MSHLSLRLQGLRRLPKGFFPEVPDLADTKSEGWSPVSQRNVLDKPGNYSDQQRFYLVQERCRCWQWAELPVLDYHAKFSY